MKFIFESSDPTKVDVGDMTIHEVRVYLSDIRVREARDVITRSLITDIAPEIGEVLAAGSTTDAHVDAIGRGLHIAGAQQEAFMAHLPELLEASTTMTVSKFGELVKRTGKLAVLDVGLSTLERQHCETFFASLSSTVSPKQAVMSLCEPNG